MELIFTVKMADPPAIYVRAEIGDDLMEKSPDEFNEMVTNAMLAALRARIEQITGTIPVGRRRPPEHVTPDGFGGSRR